MLCNTLLLYTNLSTWKHQAIKMISKYVKENDELVSVKIYSTNNILVCLTCNLQNFR